MWSLKNRRGETIALTNIHEASNAAKQLVNKYRHIYGHPVLIPRSTTHILFRYPDGTELNMVFSYEITEVIPND